MFGAAADQVADLDRRRTGRSAAAVAGAVEPERLDGLHRGTRRARVFPLSSILASCMRAYVGPFAYLADVIPGVQRTPASQVREHTPRRWAVARA